MPLVDNRIPGYNVSPGWYLHSIDRKFPIAFYDWHMNLATVRERALYWFINEATDEEDWEAKLHPTNTLRAKMAKALGRGADARWDGTTVARWRERVAQGITDDLKFLKHGFSDAMFDHCLRELKFKAEEYQRSGIVAVFDGAGVVFKSDRAVSPTLHARLLDSIKPFANIPEEDKDWHPGSRGTVHVLVNPSLWPLVYGKTRIVADQELDVNNCLAFYGLGNHTAEVSDRGKRTEFSREFQWLPAVVDVATGKARIVSYINNLHPVEHRDLYGVVEELIDAALPMWSAVYSRVIRWEQNWESNASSKRDNYNRRIMALGNRIRATDGRLKCMNPAYCNQQGWCSPDVEDAWSQPPRDKCDSTSTYDPSAELPQQPRPSHRVTHAEPSGREGFGRTNYANRSGTTQWFKPYTDTSRLQVIVQLANIELTPENPEYHGGDWHVEGLLNERICATALYYYDSDNVTPSRLSFSSSNPWQTLGSYEDTAYKTIYGSDGILIDLGSVLTREGRLLVFPNVFLHKVEPFTLLDKTRPGHRKLVALFLVDPAMPILSTANVLPQQKHWSPVSGALRPRLPQELVDEIESHFDGPFDRAEALRLRDDLIAERRIEGWARFPNSKMSAGRIVRVS
ncbi:uncharacterized protein LOC62_01G001341 [Vanrija pseudolonga]|uniref:Uncharacterized protein n=1 Tax=Vanrija pseudolonga TaxID=143232 RepID=A0AAF1BJ02_9TREE|nr:hypothetical protein LOC62_01G001341 [Vanrija pseudolonga]WOO77775.1 hypothetical protein LOC62_01G001341 [Vanrija pseudolonga]WOO77776.1 hypothetical protein LOC62_01G001341 [Vanrija pseudolonga]